MDSQHQRYFDELSIEEQHLVAIKGLLYEGSWEEMLSDLHARKVGKPHIFKLETRIDDDLERISKLSSYEEREGVDLTEYLPRRQTDLA